MRVDGSAFSERMLDVCLATNTLERRGQRLSMAEMIRVRWAVASSGGRTAGVTDTIITTTTTRSTVGDAVAVVASGRDLGRDSGLDLGRGDLGRDSGRGDSDPSLVLVSSDMGMGQGLDLGHFLERRSGTWHDDLVLALVASARVGLVDSEALGLGRVCLAEATSSMSCWTSCKSGQSMGMR